VAEAVRQVGADGGQDSGPQAPLRQRRYRPAPTVSVEDEHARGQDEPSPVNGTSRAVIPVSPWVPRRGHRRRVAAVISYRHAYELVAIGMSEFWSRCGSERRVAVSTTWPALDRHDLVHTDRRYCDQPTPLDRAGLPCGEHLHHFSNLRAPLERAVSSTLRV
jgi:hypothetical protein